MSNDAAGFAYAADRSVASPKRLSTLGSALARFQTRTPACYRASWQLPGPDFHRQATTSFRSGHDRWTITSCSLGAPVAVLSVSQWDASAQRGRSGGFDKGRRLVRCTAIGLASGLPA